MNPTPPGRDGTVTLDHVTIPVEQGLQPLTLMRDALLLDWAERRNKGEVCDAWTDLGPSGQQVFIWNTHRLHKYDMLDDVSRLYSIMGSDGDKCGGEGFNRMYMSMSEELNEKLVAAANGLPALPGWRRSLDPACISDFGALTPGECPHKPFLYQAETKADSPTGQIQLFRGGLVEVRRVHTSGYDEMNNPILHGCGTGSEYTARVKSNEVCDGYCQTNRPVGVCTGGSSYRETVIGDVDYSYTLPYDDHYEIDDGYSFEMDQDYRKVHDSAPTCKDTDMRRTYSVNHGNPGWDWEPTDCKDNRTTNASFTHSTLEAGSTPVRVIYMTDVRARVSGLRSRFGLLPFVWTDPTITYGVTPVKAVHFMELRTALNEAYVAAGRDVAMYTDDPIVAGVTPIRALHLEQVRAAILALEKAEEPEQQDQ